MKVVIGLANLLSGGTEYQMCLLADSLRSRGHAVAFYLLQDQEDPRMLSQWPAFTSRISRPRQTRGALLRFLQRVWEWRSWLKADRPDVVVGALLVPHTLLAQSTRGIGIPVIARRGFDWAELGHLPSYQRAWRFLRRSRLLSMGPTRTLVCNAEHVARSMERHEGWPPSMLRMIRNGWPDRPAIDWRNAHAIYSAQKREEKAHTALAGKEEFSRVDRVYSVPTWDAVGIYVHPSLAEGCSNAIGTAMSHAIPVVAFDLPGNRELTNGYPLAPLGDYEALGKILETFRGSRDLREELGRYGQDRVRRAYSLSRMVDTWEGLLCEASRGR